MDSGYVQQQHGTAGNRARPRKATSGLLSPRQAGPQTVQRNARTAQPQQRGVPGPRPGSCANETAAGRSAREPPYSGFLCATKGHPAGRVVDPVDATVPRSDQHPASTLSSVVLPAPWGGRHQPPPPGPAGRLNPQYVVTPRSRARTQPPVPLARSSKRTAPGSPGARFKPVARSGGHAGLPIVSGPRPLPDKRCVGAETRQQRLRCPRLPGPAACASRNHSSTGLQPGQRLRATRTPRVRRDERAGALPSPSTRPPSSSSR